ncbi:hypothetical protein SAMN05428981_105168 [Bacillus sp. OV194]|nr:hypothetical protein SAMN05428981_105168 [Bacillus sp. OV194]
MSFYTRKAQILKNIVKNGNTCLFKIKRGSQPPEGPNDDDVPKATEQVVLFNKQK